jgi:phenylalanyl-tRNA synthetase beta chain
MVEGVTLFDVYRGSNLPDATRSLAFTIRFSAPDRTLNEVEVARARELLIETARSLGAVLRGSA